jgi:hypothetical protein
MTLDSETIHLYSRNLMAIGFAAAVLANAWRKNWVYTLALLLALADTFMRYRFELHTWARTRMLGLHPQTGDKQVLQSKLLYVSIMLFCALLLLLVPYLVRASMGGRLMVTGSLLALIILSLELISPHYIDQIIYHTVGIFALSAIGYFISGILIACGAILDR